MCPVSQAPFSDDGWNFQVPSMRLNLVKHRRKSSEKDKPKRPGRKKKVKPGDKVLFSYLHGGSVDGGDGDDDGDASVMAGGGFRSRGSDCAFNLPSTVLTRTKHSKDKKKKKKRKKKVKSKTGAKAEELPPHDENEAEYLNRRFTELTALEESTGYLESISKRERQV